MRVELATGLSGVVKLSHGSSPRAPLQLNTLTVLPSIIRLFFDMKRKTSARVACESIKKSWKVIQVAEREKNNNFLLSSEREEKVVQKIIDFSKWRWTRAPFSIEKLKIKCCSLKYAAAATTTCSFGIYGARPCERKFFAFKLNALLLIKCCSVHPPLQVNFCLERANVSLTYHNDSTVIQFIVPFVRGGPAHCTTATYILFCHWINCVHDASAFHSFFLLSCAQRIKSCSSLNLLLLCSARWNLRDDGTLC